MALGDGKYSTEELGRTKAEMEAFLADEDTLLGVALCFAFPWASET